MKAKGATRTYGIRVIKHHTEYAEMRSCSSKQLTNKVENNETLKTEAS